MKERLGMCHECQPAEATTVYLCGQVLGDPQWLCFPCISKLTVEARLARRGKEAVA